MKSPDAAERMGIRTSTPMLFKIAERPGQRQSIPVIGHFQQPAAFWTTDMRFVHCKGGCAVGKNASLVDGI